MIGVLTFIKVDQKQTLFPFSNFNKFYNVTAMKMSPFEQQQQKKSCVILTQLSHTLHNSRQ